MHEEVAAAKVRELVRDRALELLPAERLQRSGRDGQRRAPRAASDDEQPREAVVDQLDGRRPDTEPCRHGVDGGAEDRVLRQSEGTCTEHPEERPVAVAVDGQRGEERAEREEHPAAGPPISQPRASNAVARATTKSHAFPG